MENKFDVVLNKTLIHCEEDLRPMIDEIITEVAEIMSMYTFQGRLRSMVIDMGAGRASNVENNQLSKVQITIEPSPNYEYEVWVSNIVE